MFSSSVLFGCDQLLSVLTLCPLVCSLAVLGGFMSLQSLSNICHSVHVVPNRYEFEGVLINHPQPVIVPVRRSVAKRQNPLGFSGSTGVRTTAQSGSAAAYPNLSFCEWWHRRSSGALTNTCQVHSCRATLRACKLKKPQWYTFVGIPPSPRSIPALPPAQP